MTFSGESSLLPTHNNFAFFKDRKHGRLRFGWNLGTRKHCWVFRWYGPEMPR